MADRSLGQSAKRTVVWLGVTVLLLGLGVAVFQLLSRLNARTFTLEEEGQALVVHKGRALPLGSEPYRPRDPILTDAYAPIPLEGMQVGELLERRFADRDELDRALFEVLEKLARPKLLSDEGPELDRGLALVRRAAMLNGLTQEQRASLKTMQTELSFYLARTRLDDARKQLAEAMAQLQVAADSNNRHARSAHQMLLEVQGPGKALEDALRRAVHTLSAPAPVPGRAAPETPPTPTPAPEGDLD